MTIGASQEQLASESKWECAIWLALCTTMFRMMQMRIHLDGHG